MLEAIADHTDETLQRGLAHLQAAEFLYQTRLFPDVEYTFKHGLTYEVAYGSLLHERRRALHARIVEVIEALYPENLTEQVERLAYHAVRSEIWEKAVRYLSQAGARALDRSAHREAASYFEQALAALTHLPETRETREQAIDLKLGIRTSLIPLGEIEAVLKHLQDAEQLALLLDDRRQLARVSIATSHHFLVTGNAEEARRYGMRAFEIAETLGDLPLQVPVTLYLGAACLGVGKFGEADEHLGRTLRLLQGSMVRERFGMHGYPAVIARSYLAWALAERGDFAGAIARGREGVDIAEAAHHAYSQAYVGWSLALPHAMRGDLVEAARLLEHAANLSREWNLPLIGALVAGLLGLTHARSGRAAEGVALLQDAATTLELTFGIGLWHSANVIWLGEALLLADRLDDARSVAERSLALTREFKHRICEPWALRLLGEINSHRDAADGELAEGYYQQAIAAAKELGMHPLVAYCHLGLGKLHSRKGKEQEARAHYNTAGTMCREMHMQGWLLEAESLTLAT